MDEKLLFMNPEFEEGFVQVTVRNGYKWYDIVSHLPYVLEVAKTEARNKAIGEAHVVGKMVLAACEIPDQILKLEHDPGCRTSNGLYAGMRKAYGDGWDQWNAVTVLFFIYFTN